MRETCEGRLEELAIPWPKHPEGAELTCEGCWCCKGSGYFSGDDLRRVITDLHAALLAAAREREDLRARVDQLESA